MSAQDIVHLSQCPSLTELQLSDQLYGHCPVIQQCNYRSYVVIHLPQLQVLDSFTIDDAEREQVKCFYGGKIIHFNMLLRNYANNHYKEILSKEQEDKLTTDRLRQQLYAHKLKELQVQSSNDTNKLLNKKRVQKNKDHLISLIKNWQQHLEEWIENHRITEKLYGCQLNYQLQNVGNMSFMQGCEEHAMVLASQKLMNQFYCSYLFRLHGIVSTKVTRVTRIYHKGLSMMHDLFQQHKKRSTNTRQLVFMLLFQPFGVQDLSESPFDIFERGFINTQHQTILKSQNVMFPQKLSVTVTDCVASGDSEWLRNRNKHSKQSRNQKRVCIVTQFAGKNKLLRVNSKCDDTKQRLCTGSVILCDKETAKQKCCNTYKVFQPREVLPMFLLEYEYIYEDSLEQSEETMSWTCDRLVEPFFPPSYCTLDNTSLLRSVKNYFATETLKELTLTGCGIPCLPDFPNITTLNLSCNQLTSLKGLQVFLNVTNIDLSFNNIQSVDTIMELISLKKLNLSWNYINQLRECLEVLKLQAKRLKHLDLSHNITADVKEMKHKIYFSHKILPELETINETCILSTFSRMLQTLNINKDETLHKGRTFANPTTNIVDLRWKVQIAKDLQAIQMGSYESGDLNEKQGYFNWLSATGKNITNVLCKQSLNKVEWLDLSDNYLSDLSFLEGCTLLEELRLTHNVLEHLPDFQTFQLTHLVKLDLSRNYLTTLAPLGASELPALRFLDVSYNQLNNLSGVEACQELSEFYAAYNKLDHYDDLSSLKNCQSLKVINLTGNEVEKGDVFTKFIIFNFQDVEYVGSYSVQESDVAEAIEIFSGCLDKDYLLRQHSASDLQTLTELTLVHCSIKKICKHSSNTSKLLNERCGTPPYSLYHVLMSQVSNSQSTFHLGSVKSQVWLPGNVLPNLYSVNLSYNMLTHMWGMHTLPTLHTLCLAHNEVCAQRMGEEELKEEEGEYYPRLQVLYLNNNKITTMKRLQLAALPALETLFLQDNQLKSLTGLKGATKLSRLVLDRNRTEFVTQEDFDGLEKLRELYLEGNKLRELFFIQGLNKLDRLFLAYNRIMDINEVSFLATLNNLKELTLLGNPLCRKVNYYQIILKHIATIELLDGHSINLNK
uniref:Leucine-rich repeat-containing protein 9 n=1 Tax=Timema poppense TaxID=170557 RepID=A0A7R9H2K8_TIMPO|nr:unnamed protein product [Timema poppensis]